MIVWIESVQGGPKSFIFKKELQAQGALPKNGGMTRCHALLVS